MSRQENKKSIGFMIFAIILSVILVVFTGGLVYQIFKLQILPDNILIPIILVLILLTLIFVLLINFSAAWVGIKNLMFFNGSCVECCIWIRKLLFVFDKYNIRDSYRSRE